MKATIVLNTHHLHQAVTVKHRSYPPMASHTHLRPMVLRQSPRPADIRPMQTPRSGSMPSRTRRLHTPDERNPRHHMADDPRVLRSHSMVARNQTPALAIPLTEEIPLALRKEISLRLSRDLENAVTPHPLLDWHQECIPFLSLQVTTVAQLYLSPLPLDPRSLNPTRELTSRFPPCLRLS